jgi:phosphatidate cytidylyltransferase
MLLNRIIYGAILIFITLFSVADTTNGNFIFHGFLSLVTSLAYIELSVINHTLIKLIGYILVTIFYYCMQSLKQINTNLLYYLFAIVWATDIGAFFTGKICGGPKLCIQISPNKTVSGCIGGLLFGTFAGTFIYQYLKINDSIKSLLILKTMFISFVAILGDLLESMAKRIENKKDSNINNILVIPGHGGVLDRIDALILASPIVLLSCS